MQASQVNFTSRIRLVDLAGFNKEIGKLSPTRSVDYPWMANQIIKAPKVFTKGIQDCTAGGITDGQDVLMFHICPSVAANKDFKKIENKILGMIDKNASDLQGFLIGGNHFVDYSLEQFEKFEDFFKNKLSIPYSKFKEHTLATVSSVFYDSTKDEIVLLNDVINTFYGKKTSGKLLEESYRDFKISDLDEIV